MIVLLVAFPYCFLWQYISLHYHLECHGTPFSSPSSPVSTWLYNVRWQSFPLTAGDMVPPHTWERNIRRHGDRDTRTQSKRQKYTHTHHTTAHTHTHTQIPPMWLYTDLVPFHLNQASSMYCGSHVCHQWWDGEIILSSQLRRFYQRFLSTLALKPWIWIHGAHFLL